jgi:protein-tyrosine phosphatase
MTLDLYWIDLPHGARLATMAAPWPTEQLESEVDHWKAEGVEIVVSLLQPAEEALLGIEAEADACRARGMMFIRFPIVDGGVPADRRAALKLAKALGRSKNAVAIHCRAGVGRASLMAALVLLQRGETPASAFALIRAARGLNVPDTPWQREWIDQFAGKS